LAFEGEEQIERLVFFSGVKIESCIQKENNFENLLEIL
jgi:hypothetical protein